MQKKLEIVSYGLVLAMCISYVYLASVYPSEAVDNYYTTCITQEDYDLAVAERDNLKELLLTQSRLVSRFEAGEISKDDFISLYERP